MGRFVALLQRCVLESGSRSLQATCYTQGQNKVAIMRVEQQDSFRLVVPLLCLLSEHQSCHTTAPQHQLRRQQADNDNAPSSCSVSCDFYSYSPPAGLPPAGQAPFRASIVVAPMCHDLAGQVSARRHLPVCVAFGGSARPTWQGGRDDLPALVARPSSRTTMVPSSSPAA